MSFTSSGTAQPVGPVEPSARWRRDTWRALSPAGRETAWSLMTEAHQDRLRTAIDEADREDLCASEVG